MTSQTETRNQQPIAWLDVLGDGIPVPVYAAPLQRTWVDLTEEELYAAIRRTEFPSTDITVSQSVIEAFKEKNK